MKGRRNVQTWDVLLDVEISCKCVYVLCLKYNTQMQLTCWQQVCSIANCLFYSNDLQRKIRLFEFCGIIAPIKLWSFMKHQSSLRRPPACSRQCSQPWQISVVPTPTVFSGAWLPHQVKECIKQDWEEAATWISTVWNIKRGNKPWKWSALNCLTQNEPLLWVPASSVSTSTENHQHPQTSTCGSVSMSLVSYHV